MTTAQSRAPLEISVVRARMASRSSSDTDDDDDDPASLGQSPSSARPRSAKGEDDTMAAHKSEYTVTLPPGPTCTIPQVSSRVRVNAEDAPASASARASKVTLARVEGCPAAKEPMMAVHCGGFMVAVVVSLPLQPPAETPSILLRNLVSGEKMALPLDTTSDRVCGLDFARLSSRFVVAAVDDLGGVHVFEAGEEEDEFRSLRLLWRLGVSHPDGAAVPSDHHGLSWCPYMPESEEDLERVERADGFHGRDGEWNPALALALVHNSVVEMLQTDQVLSVYGQGGHAPEKVLEGRLQTTSLGGPLSQVRMGSVGNMLAVVSEEPAKTDEHQIFFFTYKFKGDSKDQHGGLKKLQPWSPGLALRRVSSLSFLDNLSVKYSTKDLWNHALVGEEGNTVLTIWRLTNWTRTQTIVLPKPKSTSEPLGKDVHYIVSVQSSSEAVVVGDPKERDFYVIYLGGQDHQLRFTGIRRVSLSSKLGKFVVDPCNSKDVSLITMGDKKLERINIPHYTQEQDVSRDEDSDLKVDPCGQVEAFLQEQLHKDENNNSGESHSNAITHEQGVSVEIREKQSAGAILEMMTVLEERMQARIETKMEKTSQAVLAQVSSLRQEFSSALSSLEGRMAAQAESSGARHLALVESLKKEMETTVAAGVVEGVMNGMEGICAEYLVPEIAKVVQSTSTTRERRDQPPQTQSAGGDDGGGVGGGAQGSRATVFRLVRSGKVSKAFEEALNAGDDDLLLELCRDQREGLKGAAEGEGFLQLPQIVALTLVVTLTRRMDDRVAERLDLAFMTWTRLDLDDRKVGKYLPGVLKVVRPRLKIGADVMSRMTKYDQSLVRLIVKELLAEFDRVGS